MLVISPFVLHGWGGRQRWHRGRRWQEGRSSSQLQLKNNHHHNYSWLRPQVNQIKWYLLFLNKRMLLMSKSYMRECCWCHRHRCHHRCCSAQAGWKSHSAGGKSSSKFALAIVADSKVIPNHNCWQAITKVGDSQSFTITCSLSSGLRFAESWWRVAFQSLMSSIMIIGKNNFFMKSTWCPQTPHWSPRDQHRCQLLPDQSREHQKVRQPVSNGSTDMNKLAKLLKKIWKCFYRRTDKPPDQGRC